MSVFKDGDPESLHCDYGRSNNKCKFAASKQRGRRKALGIAGNVVNKVKKKRNKRKK